MKNKETVVEQRMYQAKQLLAEGCSVYTVANRIEIPKNPKRHLQHKR